MKWVEGIRLGILLCPLWLISHAWAVQSTTFNAPSRMAEVIRILGEVPSGQALIQKALKTWDFRQNTQLLQKVLWGEVSRTDTVLTRHYNPASGKEERERQVKIFLRGDQDILDSVLDLAHEFIHALSQPGFDPYDPNLTAGKYILTAIEGKGGEVEAVVSECRIGSELSVKLGIKIQRCHSYLNGSQVDPDKVRRDFYRIGEWMPEFSKRIGAEIQLFAHISAESPQLYSSTGHMPYPFALLQEFEEITQMACNNSRNRIRSISAALMAWRTSLGSEKKASQGNIQEFIKKRCESASFQ